MVSDLMRKRDELEAQLRTVNAAIAEENREQLDMSWVHDHVRGVLFHLYVRFAEGYEDGYCVDNNAYTAEPVPLPVSDERAARLRATLPVSSSVLLAAVGDGRLCVSVYASDDAESYNVEPWLAAAKRALPTASFVVDVDGLVAVRDGINATIAKLQEVR